MPAERQLLAPVGQVDQRGLDGYATGGPRGSGDGGFVEAVREVDATSERGRLAVLAGRSGSGGHIATMSGR